ncbi:MAG: SGNH/GDSL hydrolase family protein [Defluviitaleaceae bacterium]|nr:SGNH/GDSL hydrolase family protein [Defluviitaleaceae bacterium]MCL2274141.1 SGNH/GDSL hydrolase family protein [Defluviitaleaceae bacterium]
MRTTIVRILIAITAFTVVFFGLQRLLTPKFATPPGLEGGMMREYYRSNFDHDIIFLGDCEVYANFSPITLWEEFGITSFIRGTPQQLIWQSYYLLQDTLRFETPRMVVFNVLAMQYNEPQNEAYNRLTLDGMRWGMPKIRAISASMTEEEDWLSHVFPFFRYKDRWRNIGANDFRYFFRSPRVSLQGFMIRADVEPAEWIPFPTPRGNYQFGDKAYYYLERMVTLTAANNIELVLVKAPTLYPNWPAQWERQIVDFAQTHNLLYINFLDYIEEIGLDFNYHTFSAGLDLNVFGAEKLARFFGERVQKYFSLPDRRGEADTAEHWNALAELYHRVVARQVAELERYGRIQCFRIE